MTTEPEPLPGLEAPTRPPGALETAVRRTLDALQTEGHLSDRNAATLALALELAQIITEKRRSGRMSTIGNDARVLMELLSSLVPEDTDDDTELSQAMAAWSQALARSGGAA